VGILIKETPIKAIDTIKAQLIQFKFEQLQYQECKAKKCRLKNQADEKKEQCPAPQ
jgi:hypothetical protein